MPADATAYGYFDTSVVVKSYVREEGTARALALSRRYAFLSSALVPVELASALRRHRAEKQLTKGELEWIEHRIREDRPHWMLLEVDARVLDRAENLMRTTPVKTLDALHLASALVFQDETGLRLPFITGDEPQRRAGQALGLDVVFVK
jgi:predicted nucleic acid-binding protein